MSAEPTAVGITSTSSAPTTSTREATSRQARSSSAVVIPPGSGVPVPGAKAGSSTSMSTEIDAIGASGVAERIRARVGDRPVYVSIDIDVLDPAFAPATGTPEPGGFTSRELLGILRGLRGTRLIGADIVEVAPAYDHAEITSLAAANVAYELLSLLAAGRG